jgi:hypothetical protein
MIVVAFAAAALAAPPEFDGEVRLIGSLSPDVVVDADGTSTGQGPVLDSRVRLGLSQELGRTALVGEIDLFAGQLLGDTWDLGVTDDDRHREAYGALELRGIQPRQLNIAYQNDLLGLQAGLVTSQWGLGLVASSGAVDPLFGRVDGGDRVVRARVGTLPVRGDSGVLAVFVAGDLVAADELAHLTRGQRALQGIAGALWQGSGSDDLGIYLVYRDQVEANGLATRAGVADVFVSVEVPAGSGAITVAGEAAGILGHTERAQTYGHPEGASVLSVGAAAHATYAAAEERFSVFLRGTYASGDGAPDDTAVHDFTFDPNHNVGMVLFDEVGAAIEAGTWRLATDPENTGQPPEGVDTLTTEGSFRRAVALQLAGEVRPVAWTRVRVGVMRAWSTAPIAQGFYSARNGGVPTTHHDLASTGRALGTELDAAVLVEAQGAYKPAGELQVGHAFLSPDLAGPGPAGATLVLLTGRLRW